MESSPRCFSCHRRAKWAVTGYHQSTQKLRRGCCHFHVDRALETLSDTPGVSAMGVVKL